MASCEDLRPAWWEAGNIAKWNAYALCKAGQQINVLTGGEAEPQSVDDLSSFTKTASVYDPGNELGDVHEPSDFLTGGTEGGGGLQLPFANRYAPDAVRDAADQLTSWLPSWVPAAAIAAAAFLVYAVAKR